VIKPAKLNQSSHEENRHEIIPSRHEAIALRASSDRKRDFFHGRYFARESTI
jgi:hypothetical protein